MQGTKKLLYKLNVHNRFRKSIERGFKLLYFLKFAQWVSGNRKLAVNDFPAEGNAHKRRYLVHEHLVRQELAGQPIDYLEFGVADCETLFWWLKEHSNPDSRFYGFDTFTGLPENWGNYRKGTFSLDGRIPQVSDPRVRLYKGLFQDTLQGFLKLFENKHRKVLLLDADLYSATLFVLATMAPYLKEGDILLFDEFNAPRDEFRALQDFLAAYNYVKAEPIAAANNYACVAFRVQIRHSEPG